MKDIRSSDWFLEAASSGNAPDIRISPHQTFGKGI
jgi:hypothetical protein